MPLYSELPVSAIDRADHRFRISRADSDISALALSISVNGLLAPPVVLEKKSGNGFIIVSGFRRIEAVCSLGVETLVCKVIPWDKAKQGLKFAVIENAFQRDLTPGELVRSAALLAKEMTAQEISEESQAIFNTQFNKRYIRSLLNIAKLGSRGVGLLDTGHISIKAANAIAAFNDESSSLFIDLFSKIKCSSGKQMEILTWIREITARDKMSCDQLINGKEIQEILTPDTGHKDLGASGNRLRAALYKKRFPELDKAKKGAAQNLKALKLPKALRLSLPEHFESMVYTLSIEFTSVSEFADQLSLLADLKKRDEFKGILDRE